MIYRKNTSFGNNRSKKNPSSTTGVAVVSLVAAWLKCIEKYAIQKTFFSKSTAAFYGNEWTSYLVYKL